MLGATPCHQVSVQQADCEKDLAAAIPLVEQAEVPWRLEMCRALG